MDTLRLVVAALILLLLLRIARVAWRQRALMVAIWRGLRLRHVAGGVGILVLVATLAVTLMTLVPGMDVGLGRVVGLHGNAVFAPLEGGLAIAGPPPASGPDWALVVGATLFLLPLLVLLPWLAFVEEEIFRGGLEGASTPQLLRASLVFGLAHLAMLVPLGAALALAAAGLVYAIAYRRGYASATVAGAPAVVLAAYRPTRRARRAAAAAATGARPATVPATGARPATVPATGARPATVPATGDRPATVPATGAAATSMLAHLILEPVPEHRQAAGVYRAAVWHTATNSILVLGLWLSFVVTGLVA